MTAVPVTMKALVAVGAAPAITAPSPVEGRGATLKDVPVPTIDEGDILVKVTAVALNPTDFKHIDGGSPDGVVSGCDFAGVVAQIGAKVERLYRDVRAYAIPGGSEEIMLDLSMRQSMRVAKAMGMKL
ncbi:hypothetical protein NQ176_g9697 [Zarea fungicola]|uniref:Uncharacterized protein n=1 Tax=Zarea fungicola TaxID=93591 RepID=A0ACC1MM53_9HYPO|nr:hypothetical protein NQ176_g9697 [Lecanicillium fungicola]